METAHPEVTTKPEISKDFNPSIPKDVISPSISSNEPTASGAEPAHNKPKGLFNRFAARFTPQAEIVQGPKPEPMPDDLEKDSVHSRTQELYEKNLERVELRIDMYRKARKIASKTEVSDNELKPETSFIKKSYLQRGIQITDEQAREMAYGRIMDRRIKDILKSGESPVKPSLTPEQIKAKLLAGQTMEIEKVLSPTEDDEDLRALNESKKRLGELDEQISQLSQDPRVVSEYNEHKSKRTEILRKAMTVTRMKKRIREIEIRHDKKTRQIYLEGRQYSPAENMVLSQEEQMVGVIQETLDEMLEDSEVFDAYRLKYLQELQLGFKKDRFALTPSRQVYLDEVRHLWVHGAKVLLTGPTGGGKTELLLHASRSLFDEEAERLSGHPNMTNFEIYGKMAGKKVGEDKTVIAFEPGPYTRAVDQDKALVIDEINIIPNKVVMRMKADLNARPGQTITIQEENGVQHKVGKGFVVGAAANVKSEKHPDREEIDPAISRMFEGPTIQYLPPHELYDIMLANLMDVRGGVKLTLKDATETLKSLCDATQWTQQAYNGDIIITDPVTGTSLNARGSAGVDKPATLEMAVLDPGKAIDMLIGWEDARRQGQTLREFLNPKIVSFINKETHPAEDRYYLAEIFALQGFLKGIGVEGLNIPGLDQDTLNSWNGYDGKRYVPSKNTRQYLPSEIVAKLDPYGILQRPTTEEISDLLDEKEENIITIDDNLSIKPASLSPYFATQPSISLPNITAVPSPTITPYRTFSPSVTPTRTIVPGSLYAGLKIQPDAQARDLMNVVDRMYPNIPDNIHEVNDMVGRIIELLPNNPSLQEVAVKKLDQIADHCVIKFPELNSQEIHGFLNHIFQLLILSKNFEPIDSEVGRKLSTVVQKIRMIKTKDPASSWNNNVSQIMNYINRDLKEIIERTT